MNKIILILGLCLISTSLYAVDNSSDSSMLKGSSCHKWNPGHYLYMTRNRELNHYDLIENNSYFKGAQVAYHWSALEPSEGVYDFSAIEKDLRYLQSIGKRLIIQVTVMSFKPPRLNQYPDAVPEYLLSEEKYQGGQSFIIPKGGRAPRKGAKIWVPEVNARLIKLYENLGKRFNHEPYVEAIVTSESVAAVQVSKNPVVPVAGDMEFEGYTINNYVSAFNQGLTVLKKSFPNTTVISYANYLKFNPNKGENLQTRYKWLEAIYEHAVKIGVGIGGPDLTIPGAKNDEGLAYKDIPSYPLNEKYKNRVPTAMAVMWFSMRLADQGYWSMSDLLEYGNSRFGLNYISWQRRPFYPGGKKKVDVYDAIQAVNRAHGLINDLKPESIRTCIK